MPPRHKRLGRGRAPAPVPVAQTLEEQGFADLFPDLFSGALATAAERARVDAVRTAIRLAGTAPPPFPERRAYPVDGPRHHTILTPAWWRSVVAHVRRRRAVKRALKEGAPPCCWGYRFGAGWSHGDRTLITVQGGPLELGRIPDRLLTDEWLPVALIKELGGSRASIGGSWVDYVVLWQGPPAPCPTCGTPPPEADVERWREHVATLLGER